MQILIVTPGKRGTPLGNEVTAQRWAKMLRQLGHRVKVAAQFATDQHKKIDCLIALHAFRSSQSIERFQAECQGRPIIVGLTGTDLNRDLNSSQSSVNRPTRHSLRTADRIVTLEPNARLQLPATMRPKCRVIFQSALTLKPRPKKIVRHFEITMANHLRSVKDPFLAARAVSRLPPSSRIKICHIGYALTPDFARRARAESTKNPRYQWMGGVPHWQSRRRIARSQALLLTSTSEGGPSVFGEAIMNHVPILSTRIPPTTGMLEADYPGLFPPSDYRELADLLQKLETDRLFYRELLSRTQQLKTRFKPSTERNAWKRLIAELA